MVDRNPKRNRSVAKTIKGTLRRRRFSRLAQVLSPSTDPDNATSAAPGQPAPSTDLTPAAQTDRSHRYRHHIH